MVPKEHGAYGQIAFPLLTALLVAGASAAGLLIAIAAVAGFVAHEPAAVLLGLRGPRAQRDSRRLAIGWLVCTAALSVAAGVSALVMMPPAARWSLAMPLAPALLLATALARGQEKTWHGETAACVAFSAAAVPVSLAASASMATALAVAVPFALLFVASTLAVRVIILRTRSGGNARATTATRRAVLSVAAGGGAALCAAIAAGLLPATILMAAAPGLLTATTLATYPPQPHHLRTVGWALIAVSLVTASIVIAAT
jgi:hypothetical protein